MKTWLFRLLNLVLWLIGSLLASTGVILGFRLPPGSRGGQGLTLLGWSRHDWGDLHFWLGFLAVGLVAVHLLMHHRWIWVVACRRSTLRLCAGVGLGLVLPVLAAFWPVTRTWRGPPSRLGIPALPAEVGLREGFDRSAPITAPAPDVELDRSEPAFAR